MAHGFLELHLGLQNTHQLQYRLYRYSGPGEFELVITNTSISLLEAAAEQVTIYVRAASELFQRIYIEQHLEEA